MNKILLVCSVLALAAAAAATASPLDDLLEQSPNLRVLHKVYSECATKEAGLAPCLKARAVAFMDRMSRMDAVPLADHLTLVRVPGAADERQSRALSDAELDATNDNTLTTMLVQRVAKFVSGRSVQIDLPKVSEEEVQTSLAEGRGKMKKMMGMMMMMGGMMKFALLMLLKLKGLFFLAKKALIVSKIALFLALAVIFKKLMTGDDSHGSSGWSSGGGHGGGWDRNSYDSHNLAYKAHRP
ncbi:uncharacterized protein LOC132192421 [Neocloeon triangulifer]|uniref:uncharacterized protein LOC132192421 n=1 Tax=Neocloeon triangulifer TaxID=2078957 RepID=UPI00286F8CEC|nr:uncharacterized protein LOC132192421 [Neocloeon triangulifer]